VPRARYPTNNIQLTCPSEPSKTTHPADAKKRLSDGSSDNPPRPAIKQPQQYSRSAEAARAAADRRWNADLVREFSSMPIYAEIIDAMDSERLAAATEAEMNRTDGLADAGRESSRTRRSPLAGW
jgi:hypothetical protein